MSEHPYFTTCQFGKKINYFINIIFHIAYYINRDILCKSTYNILIYQTFTMKQLHNYVNLQIYIFSVH